MRTIVPPPLGQGEVLEDAVFKYGRAIIAYPVDTFSDVKVANYGNSNNCKELFERLLLQGDEPADRFLLSCMKDKSTLPEVDTCEDDLPTTILGVRRMMQKDQISPVLAKKLADVLGIGKDPDWLNMEAIARGQKFYYRIKWLADLVLAYSSLSGGYGVPRVDDVLHMTGGITKKSTAWMRLLNTLQYVMHTAIPGELRIGGKGWWDSVRSRLGHAFVRHRALELRKKQPTALPGSHVPINQLDMARATLGLKALTIASFQIVVIVGLRRLAPRFFSFISKETLEDFTHFWRYNGFLMGLTDEANPCLSIDGALRICQEYGYLYCLISPSNEEALAQFNRDFPAVQTKDSKDAGVMAKQLYSCMHAAAPMVMPSCTESAALARILMSDEYCDAMGIEPASRMAFFAARVRIFLVVLVSLLASFLSSIGLRRTVESFEQIVPNKLLKVLKEEAKRQAMSSDV
ncbi:hypothetical protein HDU84_009231 [Entophlyctis sp. JEL0112]|nr:hypothetical protein HDU84_009231 [Entophlyctis sp. JEL0112]